MPKSGEHVTSLENKISLPRPQCDGAVSLEKALLHRRSVRDFSDQRLELWHISQLAWAAQGITGLDVHRTAPSAGALFPLDLYVAVGNVIGLAPGIYKYVVRDHDLVPWLQGDKRRQLYEAALSQSSIYKLLRSSSCQRSTREPRRNMESAVFDTFIWKSVTRPKIYSYRPSRLISVPSSWGLLTTLK